MLKSLLKGLLKLMQWTPFNRDSLWNLCIAQEHCTWRPWLAKEGMTFCHVNDETQQHREKHKTALIVKHAVDSHTLILEVQRCAMNEQPIAVGLSKPTDLKEGDVFNVWGQYRLAKNTAIGGQSYTFVTQLNEVNEHVFKEPFIDYGQFDR